MSEVLVRNLDEAVVEQLKARARGSGRSLQAELKLILEQAARPAQRGRAGGVPRSGRPGPCRPRRPAPGRQRRLLAEDRRVSAAGIAGDSASMPGRRRQRRDQVARDRGPHRCSAAAAPDDAPAMHVPDLVFPEVGNILWKKIRRGDLTEEQRGIAHLVEWRRWRCTPRPLLEAALEITMRTGRTVYDSLYVALAVQMDCRLVTADERLYNALKDGPWARILWVEGDLGIPVIGELRIS